MWGVDEQVSVELVIDSALIMGSQSVYFFSPNSRAASAVDAWQGDGNIQIDWTQQQSMFDTSVAVELEVITVTAMS